MARTRHPRPGAGLIAALQRLTHLAGRHLAQRTAGLRIGQAEAHVLAHLAAAGSGTIAGLHHGFGHKRSTLTSVLDRLEARGLVARGVDGADRRSVRLTLTPKGIRAARRVAAAVRHLEARALREVPGRAVRGFWETLGIVERSLR